MRGYEANHIYIPLVALSMTLSVFLGIWVGKLFMMQLLVKHTTLNVDQGYQVIIRQ